MEPGRRVVFGWGWDGLEELPPDASTVTVTIQPRGSGCRVTLEHTGLTEDQAARHGEGWSHYLERLERLAATGDAGPDEWAAVPDPLNPVSACDVVLAALQRVLRNITEDDFALPTPCSDMSLGELVEHLLASLSQLASMAGADVEVPSGGAVEDRISVAAGQCIQAWRSIDLDGTVPGPGGAPMPASYAAAILTVELTLHGWDLAQASGQAMHLSDELVDYVRTLAETTVPDCRPRGSFAQEVTAPVDAGSLDRLAAYAGRSPLAS